MARIETLRASDAQSKSSRRRRGLIAAAIAGVLGTGALVNSAGAGTFTWDTNISGAWTAGTNWIGGIAPTGANITDNLIFGGTEGVTYQSNADTIDPFIINGLTLNSTATTSINQIGFLNSQGISLAGTNPFITQNGTGAFQIDAPLIFTSNTTFGGTGTGQVTLNGALSGAGNLRVTSGYWR